MVIKELKKYLSKQIPSLDITKEIKLCRKYSNLVKVEDSIKRQMSDFAFLCSREDRNKVFNIEISLGSYAVKDPSLRKERAIEFSIAEDYLKDLLEKKVIQKYSIFTWQSKYTGSCLTIRLGISLRPKDVMRIY